MAELVLVVEDAVQRHTQRGPHQPAQLAVVVVVLRDQMSVSEVGREVVSCQWRSSIFKYFDMPVVSCLEERKLRAVRTRPRAPQPPRRARRLAPRH